MQDILPTSVLNDWHLDELEKVNWLGMIIVNLFMKSGSFEKNTIRYDTDYMIYLSQG